MPTRREMLWQTGGGLGGIALAWLIGADGAGARAGPDRPRSVTVPRGAGVGANSALAVADEHGVTGSRRHRPGDGAGNAAGAGAS